MTAPKQLAVIGAAKINNSRSPLIHNHWIKENGLEADYRKIEIKAGADFQREFLDLFAADNPQKLFGANITVPYKEAAYAALKNNGAEMSALAQRLGAVNLVYRKGDKLCGDNTDGAGFLSSFNSLAADKRNVLTQKPILILGAGGAARAIAAVLSENNNEIYLSNRTKARAENLVKELDLQKIKLIDWEKINAVASSCSLLVNTSALGMIGSMQGSTEAGDSEKIKTLIAALPDAAVVCDIVYTPLKTEFLRNAEARGLLAIDGLAMLLGQAALSFQLWFDINPAIDDNLRQKLIEDLK